MLNSLLSAATLRRIVSEVPDARILPYGGPWGQRVPDVPADHRELVEYDRNIPPAADLLAYGAQSRDVVERPTEVLSNRAFRIKSSDSLRQSDMEVILSVLGSGGAVARDRQALLGIANRHIERRLQSVAITRGILLAGMACGDLSWSIGGYVVASLDFGMPASLKLTPTEYWIDNAGAANADATPITDLVALDEAAKALGGSPYTAIDMSRALHNAMLASTEYQTQAKALSSVYQVGSLPVAGSEAAIELSSRVLGKRISIVDQTFEIEGLNGERTTGRYVPAKYVVAYREAEAATGAAYDFANCPITESAVAAMAGAAAFGGDVVRGPESYVTCDEQGFSWVRMNATQEGTPRRHARAATARILAQEPA